jgi:hypothetical protein
VGHHHHGLGAAKGAQGGQGLGMAGVGGGVHLGLDRRERWLGLPAVNGQHALVVASIYRGEHALDPVQVAGMLGLDPCHEDLVLVIPTPLDLVERGQERAGRAVELGPDRGTWFQSVLAFQRLLGPDREAGLLVGVAQPAQPVSLAGRPVGAERRPEGKPGQQHEHSGQPRSRRPGAGSTPRPPLPVHAEA